MKAHNVHLDTNTAYAYTGILVLADALERAGSTKPDDIVAALRKTDFKDHPVVGGPIKFAPNGDNTGALTALIQVQPDPDHLKRVRVVLPKEFAQAPDYTFPAPQLWERG
jgi:branched-chain amino acid transport system substrate-binding protein